MQLEVGKTYINREGNVRTIVNDTSTHRNYPFADNFGDTYTAEGRITLSTPNHLYDLIREAVPSPPEIQVQEVKANDIQFGGDHYKSQVIQPWDYITSNDLGFLEGNAVKYLSRFRQKNGIEDLKKARHYIDKLIEVETEKLNNQK